MKPDTNEASATTKDSVAEQKIEASPQIPGGIPTARVTSRKPGWLATLAGSYMWLLTLVCLGVAIALVWWSIPQRGIQIMVRFPEGHGLEAEDTVRFRGIEVGTVEKVQLNQSLSGVDVTVNLKPFAEPIAREGSRFWIVRPELSLSQVSGLETAVGHKYIGVMPGNPEGPWQVRFDGMAKSPPDLTDGEGTEIILRGEQRFGINPGSPLSFRGIVVGRVLSVDISRDAKTVESRVRVFEAYTKLVTSKTRFWASSGVDLDLRWGSGLKVNVESLETIVKGGVSMLTVGVGGKPVQPGQLFELAAAAEDEWFEEARLTPVTEVENLRSALKIKTSWKQSGIIYGTVDKEASCVATYLHFPESETPWVLVVPEDMTQPPVKAEQDTFQLQVIGLEQNLLEQLAQVESLDADATQPMSLLKGPPPARLGNSIAFEANEFRVPQVPEKALAVRAEGELGDYTFLHIPIEIDQISEDWSLKDFDGDRDVWHGAPVVADRDGRLIGFLWVENRAAKIVPVWSNLEEAK